MPALTQEKKIKHLAWVIAISFFASVAAYLFSFFFPPDLSTDPPIFPEMMFTLGQIQTAFYILGVVGLGIKLAEEKKTIPAIGFTMMSIGQGVLFVLMTLNFTSHQDIEEAYKTFSATLYLMVPSMVLIAYYEEFPKWLNIAGVAATLPYIAENIIFRTTHHFSQSLMIVDGFGQLGFNAVAIGWAVIVLKNAKKEIEKLKG